MVFSENFGIDSIQLLPPLNEIRKRAKALAALDAILSPDWQYRFFSYNSLWNPEAGEEMASMRDGEGSEYFILFSQIGVAGKVLLKDKTMIDPEQKISRLPNSFLSFKQEKAFSLNEVTCYFWQIKHESLWELIPNNLKSIPLLGFLAGTAHDYKNFADDYYEIRIPVSAIELIFQGKPITQNIIKSLNPHCPPIALENDFREIFGN